MFLSRRAHQCPCELLCKEYLCIKHDSVSDSEQYIILRTCQLRVPYRTDRLEYEATESRMNLMQHIASNDYSIVFKEQMILETICQCHTECHQERYIRFIGDFYYSCIATK